MLDGDTDAFRFIIKQYQDEAYSLAISVVKDEFLAKDVAQNAFIKAYTKLDTFKWNSRFSTWLVRIVINEAFIQLRKQKRQTKIAEGILKQPTDPPSIYLLKKLKKITSVITSMKL
ncbi:MAG: sigma-70 family RNA polymerase sigma factor [Balneolaceae bacterium]|nr:sigma-70 family RNA polymerase sigma factor [Balneolaceae bacterium]